MPAKPEVVESFLEDPRGLIAAYPAGGVNLYWETETLIVSGDKPLRSLESVLAIANAKQSASIGMAFQQVYSSCNSNYPNLARQIDQVARVSTNQVFRRAFYDGISDVTTSEVNAKIDGGPETAHSKLGFGNLGSPQFRDPKKPLPVTGDEWFVK